MKLLLVATFAGGCFWCMQPPFDSVSGVIKSTVGYMGGVTPNPTYEEVCSGTSGYLEVIQIEYDPSKVSYDTLLNIYWKNIDPTNDQGQFADIGPQYKPAILYHNDEQKHLDLAPEKRIPCWATKL